MINKNLSNQKNISLSLYVCNIFNYEIKQICLHMNLPLNIQG